MQHVIEQLEQEQIGNKKITPFSIGDTVTVKVKIKEGDRERLQAYQGVVIAKKNRGINSSFTVRKISHGEGVERVFQTHSPQISSIKLERRGDVRKAKLYHLRELSGRKARIREKIVTKNTKEEAAPEVAALPVEVAVGGAEGEEVEGIAGASGE